MPSKASSSKKKNPKGRRVGLVIVHTGNGKGKTTAALGTAMRAVGVGFKVKIIQFIKGSWDYGELHSAQKLGIEMVPMGEGFTWETKNRERDTAVAWKTWEACRDAIAAKQHDLLVFDEINNAIAYGYLDIEPVLAALRKKPKDMHVILTGRDAHPDLIAFADLVTEMREIKHPFQRGIYAQRGIEY
ncbi:MAG: cob(I)yrinic acid a,c-diamide adenosyltransferase [Candidatus Krumholzibacteria bacterium]|nr:cob(I)yrinic acid a,c-diamide adenosyltransferase [Candidatus Krumholzibacteria bacterium]MDH4338036.1 cob(I)yrinic acid a,c-diamide adenosyltransferase [Candidatus Krumholzibacteria bacterium]MDH5269387.1 cob(I)yrinic acid a,c-diamide adenosyltransferase [Candidatus Krumholzibacteria bacterium]